MAAEPERIWPAIAEFGLEKSLRYQRTAGSMSIRDSALRNNSAMNIDRLVSQFRISAAMKPYVLRIRLRGSDFDFGCDPETAATFTKCIQEMRRILIKKRVPAIAADRAILKTLEAAVDFQLADLRYRSLKTMEVQSLDMLDRLIKRLRRLLEAITQLPPTAKGELNKSVSAIFRQATFDSEVFIEIIDAITATLPQLAPRRTANHVFSIIHPEPADDQRSPMIDQWEAMPATTRLKIERLVQQSKPSASLVEWLNRLVDLLGRSRPVRKIGAPRSITRAFVLRVATIWRSLGLPVGLAYNFFLHPGTGGENWRGGRVESRFQRYCRAALMTFGDPTKISSRQITNYKNKRRKEL